MCRLSDHQIWVLYVYTGDWHLTYLPLDKMAAILADDKFKCIFSNENDRILIWIFFEICSQESNWQ